jgi:hypothetical protein
MRQLTRYALIGDDLVVEDGRTHYGADYALTFQGKRKLRHMRELGSAA